MQCLLFCCHHFIISQFGSQTNWSWNQEESCSFRFLLILFYIYPSLSLSLSLSPVVEGSHGNDGLLLGRPMEEPEQPIADKSLLEIVDGIVMMYNLSVHQQLGKVREWDPSSSHNPEEVKMLRTFWKQQQSAKNCQSSENSINKKVSLLRKVRIKGAAI